MNSLDIMAVAVMLITLVQAWNKGLVAEIAELALAAAGLLVAFLFHANIEVILLRLGVGNPLAAVLGFVSPFLFFIILGEVGSARIKNALGRKGLGWRDRFWSLPVGLTRGLLINSVLFLALMVFPVNSQLFGSSRTAPLFLAGAKVIIKVAPESFRSMIPGSRGNEIPSPPREKMVPSKPEREEKEDPDENKIHKI